MRFYCLLIILVFVMIGGMVSSSEALEPEGRTVIPEIRREIASRMDRPLPDIQTILPGYQPPPKNSVGLVIGNLDVSSADEIPWGIVIGQILRWQLPYGPPLLVRTPHLEPDRFRSDLYVPGTEQNRVAMDVDALVPAFKRLGLENGLTGKGKLDAAKYSLTFELYSLPDKSLKKTYSFEGIPSELPQIFGTLSVSVLADLGVEISDATRTAIIQSSPKSFEDLRWYAGMLKKAETIEVGALLEEIEEKWRSGADFPAMTPLLCFAIHKTLMEKGIDVGPKYQAILDRYPRHAGVTNSVYRGWSFSRDRRAMDKLLPALSRIIRENPLDSTALFRLGEAYMLGGGDPMEGLALILQAVEMFPRYFRSWWSLSVSLQRVRMVLFPDLEEQPLLDFYNEMDQISSACLSRALKMFPESPELTGVPQDQPAQGAGGGSQLSTGSAPSQTQATTETSPPRAGQAWNPKILASDEQDPRLIIAALRESLDSPYSDSTLQLFWRASNQLDQADQDGMLDDETLFSLAQELGEMAKDTFRFAVSGKISGALRCLLRCGMKDLAREEAHAEVNRYKESNEFNSRQREELAEVAIYLGDGDLATACFDSYKPMSTRSVPNREDFIESLRALIPAAQGRLDETKALLEKRIAESEDNLYSRLRYLEFSLQQPVEETVKQECVKYLIDYVPMEIKLGTRPNFQTQLPEGYGPLFFQAILRHIAKGHVARASGDHVKALKCYREADSLASKSRMLLLKDLGHGEFPRVFNMIWDERRIVFSKAEIQPEVNR
jgi:tetratricopeptide (TPR) repeat protein